jgi:hypothetical protein
MDHVSGFRRASGLPPGTLETEISRSQPAHSRTGLLTGHPPRDFAPGCDPIAVIMRDDPIPLAARAPGLPPALTAIIDEALSETRPMPAAELRDALHAVPPAD